MSEKSTMQQIGDNYRVAGGLPKRKGAKPESDGPDVAELQVATEPKGGYGGVGGVNTIGSEGGSQAPQASRTKLASGGSDIIGTEFGEGKVDPSVKEESIARKEAKAEPDVTKKKG